MPSVFAGSRKTRSMTDRVTLVIGLTHQEAVELGVEEADTEHVLLGLLREGHGVAGVALRALGLSYESVRTRFDRNPGSPHSPSREVTPFTPRVKEAFRLAAAESQRAGSDRIETEHLLLALATVPHGVAADILAGAGVDEGALRAEIDRILTTDPPGRLPDLDDVNQEISRLEDAAAVALRADDLDLFRELTETRNSVVEQMFDRVERWRANLDAYAVLELVEEQQRLRAEVQNLRVLLAEEESEPPGHS
ncbi:Clp protease N-terminal domain-containing protein [Frankia sp. AvcI1]|uniref:Clp protease N-terminal domain-containing protein n=1 Tax=Frankia sp. AvcI1 TaxID=573496 RepID=UPI002118D2FB|nr:Clp protease N-terminal domain-containing protein [Frankia sp. AvcI1]